MFRCHPPLPPRPPLRLPLSWLTIFASFFLSEIQVSLRISSSADIFFPSAHSTANAGRVRGERYSHLCDIADVSPSRLLFNQTRSHGWIVNVFAVFRIAHTHTHTLVWSIVWRALLRLFLPAGCWRADNVIVPWQLHTSLIFSLLSVSFSFVVRGICFFFPRRSVFNHFQGGLKVLPIERDRGNNMIQAYWLSVFSVGRPLNFVPFFFLL